MECYYMIDVLEDFLALWNPKIHRNERSKLTLMYNRKILKTKNKQADNFTRRFI